MAWLWSTIQTSAFWTAAPFPYAHISNGSHTETTLTQFRHWNYGHGAGWVMGDATTHDRLVRELAVGTNATVVFLDYDRAPEHGYPVAIEEALRLAPASVLCI